MSDSAKGTVSGFIFQFEKALLMLSKADDICDIVAIENVDDVAVINSDSVILTVQAKHSISSNGNAFGDTSYALWRTIEIWITKIKQKIFNKNTKFICCSNKLIPQHSLLRKFETLDFPVIWDEIKMLKALQEEKLREIKKEDNKAGNSIEKILRIIRKVLREKDTLELIIENIEVHIEKDAKNKFFNAIRLNNKNYSKEQKDRIYDEFHGWIINRSQAKWRNKCEAKLSKKDFDEKYFQIISNPTITNLVFRTKKDLRDDTPIKGEDIKTKYTELFVKQIDEIRRNGDAKERIIKNAITDFIYYNTELAHIITEGNYTEHDFEEFRNQCFDIWEEKFDKLVIYDIDDYNDIQKNELAIKVFDGIMEDMNLKFKDHIDFNRGNIYFKKGCFLELSNIPKIGWHPEWKEKYINGEN